MDNKDNRELNKLIKKGMKLRKKLIKSISKMIEASLLALQGMNLLDENHIALASEIIDNTDKAILEVNKLIDQHRRFL